MISKVALLDMLHSTGCCFRLSILKSHRFGPSDMWSECHSKEFQDRFSSPSQLEGDLRVEKRWQNRQRALGKLLCGILSGSLPYDFKPHRSQLWVSYIFHCDTYNKTEFCLSSRNPAVDKINYRFLFHTSVVHITKYHFPFTSRRILFIKCSTILPYIHFGMHTLKNQSNTCIDAIGLLL